MNRSLFRALLVFVVSTSLATANAQLPQIQLTGVFPPGGQRGTAVDITITAGTDLDEISELIFSHQGLKATPKLDANGTAITNQFTVTVDAGVQPGLYDLRARGLFGISNPRIFRIDTIGEVAETEPNNAAEQAHEVALNTIVNARSNGATDVDFFKVKATAKQTIVFRSEAAVLDSLIQPVLELFDSTGRRVAQSRRQKQQEASIVYTSEIDQDLLLKVHDIVYGGGNDYGYRISVDTRPLVDFTMPSVLQAGVDSKVTLYGRHLPGGQPTEQLLDDAPLFKQEVSINVGATAMHAGADSAAAEIDTILHSAVDGNLLRFGLNTVAVPAVIEVDQPDALVVAVPTDIAASFATELDEDVYRFAATKGQQWQIDVLADRLGSSADPVLILEQVVKAADGAETLKRLAREDVGKQNPGGNDLPTLTSDPSFLLTAPEDGQYQVRLSDQYGASRGNPGLTYTLSIKAPQPGFQVVLFDSQPSADGKAPPVTGAISLRKGGTYTVPVYAYRTGGHNADIRILPKELPNGITVSSAVIPAGKSSTTLVLTAAPDAEDKVSSVFFMAASENIPETAVKVATLVHAGANGLPRTARVTDALLVSVMKDEEPFQLTLAVVDVQMTQDQQLLIPLKLIRRAGFVDKVDISFAGQPGNVDVPALAFEKDIDSAVARFYFKENAAVGPATLLMYATAKVPYRRNPWLAERAQVKVTEAAAQLAVEQKQLADSKAAVEAGTKNIAAVAIMVKTVQEEIKVSTVAQEKLKGDLKTAIAGKTAATQQLLALQEQLTAATAGLKDTTADVDAAIKAVADSAASVQVAAKPVLELIASIQQITVQVNAKQQEVVVKTQQIADMDALVKTEQQKVDAAKAAVTTAEAMLKTREAEKKAADDAAKKAEESTKAKPLNLRTIAIPVQLQVHTTPGKITAAVPGDGAIKKGESIEVKVTLARKNAFAGAVKVALALPDGVANVSSDTVEIPADKTEATLKFTAAADSGPIDVANAVVRAAAEFNGRTAHFDVPVKLKVTE
jgi:hypothetical protein